MTWLALVALAWSAGGAPAPAPPPEVPPARDLAADLATPADTLLRAAQRVTLLYGAHAPAAIRVRRWPGPVLVRCDAAARRTTLEIGWLAPPLGEAVAIRVRIPAPARDPRPRWESARVDGGGVRFRAKLRSSDRIATLRGRVRWRGAPPTAVPAVVTVPAETRVAPSDHPVLVARCRAGVAAEP
jgi:hypothetical protein